MIFKKKYKIFLFAILPIILLSIIAFNQYKDKIMYEKYISQNVSADMHRLVRAIIKSDEIYVDILDKKSMTRGDADELKIYSYVLLEVPQDYGGLALVFNRRGKREFKNKTAGVAQKMGSFFFQMNEDVDVVDGKNIDEKLFDLNSEKEAIISRLKELNDLWVKSVLKNVVGVTEHNGKLQFDTRKFQKHYGDNSLADDFWVDLVMDLDKNTRDFLTKHQLTTENILTK